MKHTLNAVGSALVLGFTTMGIQTLIEIVRFYLGGTAVSILAYPTAFIIGVAISMITIPSIKFNWVTLAKRKTDDA